MKPKPGMGPHIAEVGSPMSQGFSVQTLIFCAHVYVHVCTDALPSLFL